MRKTLISLVTVVIFISLIIVFSFSGCTSVAEEPEAEEEAVAEEPEVEEEPAVEAEEVEEIFFVHAGVRVGAPYRIGFETTLANKCEEMGVKLTQFDNDFNVEKGIAQIEDAIILNPDVLITPAIDAEAYVAPLKKVYEAGIPVVIETANVVEEGWKYINAYVGSDFELMGMEAAELLVEGMHEKFGEDLSDKKVVIIEGDAGEDGTIKRTLGFENKMAEIAPEIEIIDKQPTPQWETNKAIEIMENWLVKYEQIDGIFAEADYHGTAAIAAMEDAGRGGEAVVIGVAGTKDGVASIRAGNMYGIVLEDPGLGALLSFDVAYKIANGEEVEFWNVQPSPKITLDNIGEYEGW